MKSICGLDCGECGLRNKCGGCAETNGNPFGGFCMVALCCENKRCENCGKAFEAPCRLKEQLIAEFNGLGIEDMEEVTGLNALPGAYVNLEYTLPGGKLITSTGFVNKETLAALPRRSAKGFNSKTPRCV